MPSQIRIRAPFFARYTLLVESDMKAVNAVMQSKVQIRWDVRVMDVNDQYVEMEILMLDNMLLESNNPLIKEVAGISQVFGRMYNELHLITSHKGKLLKVLNMDLIKSKWAQTKRDMQAAAENNPELKSVLTLHDNLFNDEERLMAGIQGSEFFMVYFNEVYGNNLPFTKANIEKNNFFNTALITWEYNVQLQEDIKKIITSPTVIVQTTAIPAYKPDPGFNQKAYMQFADQIDISKLQTSLTEEGTYIIEKETGKLLEAVLQRNEVAHAEKLFTKMTYTIIAENRINTILPEDFEESTSTEKKKRMVYFGQQN